MVSPIALIRLIKKCGDSLGSAIANGGAVSVTGEQLVRFLKPDFGVLSPVDIVTILRVD